MSANQPLKRHSWGTPTLPRHVLFSIGDMTPILVVPKYPHSRGRILGTCCDGGDLTGWSELGTRRDGCNAAVKHNSVWGKAVATKRSTVLLLTTSCDDECVLVWLHLVSRANASIAWVALIKNHSPCLKGVRSALEALGTRQLFEDGTNTWVPRRCTLHQRCMHASSDATSIHGNIQRPVVPCLCRTPKPRFGRAARQSPDQARPFNL